MLCPQMLPTTYQASRKHESQARRLSTSQAYCVSDSVDENHRTIIIALHDELQSHIHQRRPRVRLILHPIPRARLQSLEPQERQRLVPHRPHLEVKQDRGPAVLGEEQGRGPVRLPGQVQPPQLARDDERVHSLREADQRGEGRAVARGDGRRVQLQPERPAHHGDVRAERQRDPVAARLPVGQGADVRAHRRRRVRERGAELDREPGERVRVVAGPDLREVLEHAWVLGRVLARTEGEVAVSRPGQGLFDVGAATQANKGALTKRPPPLAHPSQRISGNRLVRVSNTRYNPSMYAWSVPGAGSSCMPRLLSHFT